MLGCEAGLPCQETAKEILLAGWVPGIAGLFVHDQGLRGLRDAGVSAGATATFAPIDVFGISALADVLAVSFPQ